MSVVTSPSAASHISLSYHDLRRHGMQCLHASSCTSYNPMSKGIYSMLLQRPCVRGTKMQFVQMRHS